MNVENKFLNIFRFICILEFECILYVLCLYMVKYDSFEYLGDRLYYLVKKLFKNEIY